MLTAPTLLVDNDFTQIGLLVTTLRLQNGGAEGTARALRLFVNETVKVDNGQVARAPFAMNGPAYTFPAAGIWYVRRGVLAPEFGAGGSGAHGGKNSGVRPSRITVYWKFANPPRGAIMNHWGAHIALHEDDNRPISNATGFQERPVEGNFPGATGANGPGALLFAVCCLLGSGCVYGTSSQVYSVHPSTVFVYLLAHDNLSVCRWRGFCWWWWCGG